MFRAELLERAARFRSAAEDPTRNLQSCPSLVLNADYTPLSYYPLSLWPWQTAIKAIFLDRVDVIASYDREVHSPNLDMKIPSVIALKLVKPKLILAMGGTAAESLTGTRKGILSRRGRIEDTPHGPVFLTVHPSYLLRLPDHARAEAEAAFRADLARAAQTLTELTSAA